MTTAEYINEGEKALLHTYNRYQIILEKGEGMHLYDYDGKEYLDFCAGIAVFALGYGNKRLNLAMKNQIDKLIHTSNYYYSVPSIEAACALTKAAKMDRVFFTNSGAEAVEGAIKAARKYYFNKTGKADGEIIAMEHSFHGRTMGALSVTGNAHYREAFEPLIGNVRFAQFNDLSSVKNQITDKTAAIIMETLQGEGGIHPANPEFIKGVRDLCNEHGVLLILDEIQCGMGRTGKMYAYEHYDILPDIMTTAKAVGCGVPVGAFMMTEEVAKNSLVPGDHGSTYGGNPFVCAAVREVLKIFEEDAILNNVNLVAPYLEEKLTYLESKYDFIIGHRGMGLMQGLVFDASKKSPAEVTKKALENGLILITAGADVIRFLPPLIVSKEDVDEMIVRLEASLR